MLICELYNSPVELWWLFYYVHETNCYCEQCILVLCSTCRLPLLVLTTSPSLIGNQKLWTQDSSDPRHLGTGLVGPSCPDTSAPVLKSPKDSSDISAELSHHMD